MSNMKTGFWFSGFIVSTLFAVHANAQQCHSCLDANQVYQVDGGPANCHLLCAGHQIAGMGCFQEMCDHIAHLQKINRVVSDRNEAWPKPFACADRQLYFQTWDPMLEAGWKSACVFNSRYFMDGTAELNPAGKMKVAAIMKNYPVGQKAFYLERDRPVELSDERLVALKNSVEQWYGLDHVTEIAFTDRGPLSGDGSRAASISENYINSLPNPVIPIENLGSSLESDN